MNATLKPKAVDGRTRKKQIRTQTTNLRGTSFHCDSTYSDCEEAIPVVLFGDVSDDRFTSLYMGHEYAYRNRRRLTFSHLVFATVPRNHSAQVPRQLPDPHTHAREGIRAGHPSERKFYIILGREDLSCSVSDNLLHEQGVHGEHAIAHELESRSF